MSIVIEKTHPEHARALIDALDDYLNRIYPPEENAHLATVEELAADNAIFAGAWWPPRRQWIAMGALLYYDGIAELKRLYVLPEFRGGLPLGGEAPRASIAAQLIEFLERDARRRRTPSIYLETGIYQPEAMGLYRRLGYHECGAFANYSDEAPYSVYFCKHL